MAQRARRKIFLKQWRKFRGYTQEQLGLKMGSENAEPVSNAHISHLESGRQQYTQDMLERLALALECEPYDLLIGPPDALDDLPKIAAKVPPEERQRAAQVLSAFTSSAGSQQDAA